MSCFLKMSRGENKGLRLELQLNLLIWIEMRSVRQVPHIVLEWI